ALLAVAAVATLATPVMAVLTQRHQAFATRRDDLTGIRPSARRHMVEAVVVLLAVLGVVLVRRRGLAPFGGVDPYLVVVPVLVAVAVALVVLRVVPVPLRLAGRLAARGRGVVTFLGLAGAGRGAAARIGPLAVLVVTVATGVFTATVATTVDTARDRAADRTVPGDALIAGVGFTRGTADRVAAMPGVKAAAPLWTGSGALADARGRGWPGITVQIVDGAATQRVLELSCSGLRLPSALTKPSGDGIVPALVTPDLAAEIAAGWTVEVQGNRFPIRVAAVDAEIPGVAPGIGRVMVLSAPAIPVPVGQTLRFNRITVAGTGADPAALRDAGAAAQRDDLTRSTGRAPPEWRLQPTTVTTRTAYRATLEDTSVNRVLAVTFAAGAAGSLVLALLTVALAVLAGAPGRAVTLTRLRLLGLSPAQERGLLLGELLPLTGLAVLAGGLAGAALPALIGPALGLSVFTAGIPARPQPDLLLAAVVLAATVPAVVVALLVESAATRRTVTLRSAEENP
ncbi:FtsX-like permease family protein, partial [Actinoplanes sp. NPDC051633]|uniref:FtsX-like permease family protein n=1 Tax=Actinoplanes sp. NPDC051633 TaxID=3155670 RepID=UPI003417E22A